MALSLNRTKCNSCILYWLLLPVFLVIPFSLLSQTDSGSVKRKVADSAKIEYHILSDRLTGKHIQPGTDKNGAQLLKRLNGVIVQNYAATQNALQPGEVLAAR